MKEVYLIRDYIIKAMNLTSWRKMESRDKEHGYVIVKVKKEHLFVTKFL